MGTKQSKGKEPAKKEKERKDERRWHWFDGRAIRGGLSKMKGDRHKENPRRD